MREPRVGRWARSIPALVASVLALLSSIHAQPAWPQFRGPTGQGIAESARPPVTFSPTNALWATELPAGHSSPCVRGDWIFLTTCDGPTLECRAYRRADGQLAWTRPVEVEKIEPTHSFNNAAAPTPVADEARAIFYFGSRGLRAYSHRGDLVWERKLPQPVSRGQYGTGSSPVLCGDLVIQAVDTDEGGSRLFAFRRATGELAWETPRPFYTAGWSTPIVWPHRGDPEIILLGSKKLAAYAPADGRELWSVAGFPLETVPSPAFDEDHVFACSAGLGGRSNPTFDDSGWTDLLQFDPKKDGRIQISEVPESYRIVQRPELPEGHPGRLLPFPIKDVLQGMDKDKDGVVTREEWTTSLGEFERTDLPVLMALCPKAPGSAGTNLVSWQLSRGIPEIPSPLCYQGRIYLVRDGGILQAVDAASGAPIYNERLGVSGGYAASPVAAQGRIYFASQSGTIVVIDAAPPKLAVLARNVLGETITATPAMVEDKLYIRTARHLFAFGGR